MIKLSISKSVIVFIVSFVVYLITFTHTYYLYADQFGYRGGAIFFTGDEPHYLLSAMNLAHNHSFFMEKIYGFPYSDVLIALGTDWHAIYHDGHFTYIRDPGLTLLLAPSYYLGGSFLAGSTIVSLFAILNVIIFKTCSKFVSEKTAFITALIFGFTTLLFPYSNQVYTDVIMGILALSILNLVFFHSLSKKNLLLIGVLLGFGILLKILFLIVILVVLSVLLIKLIKNDRSKHLVYTILGGSGFSLFFVWYNHVYFGSLFFNYCTNCNGNPIIFLSLLLFDRYYGLIIFSPIIILSFYGIVHAYVKNKPFLVASSVIAVSWALLSSVNSALCCGEDYPARFLTTLIPISTIPFACAFERYRRNPIFLGFTALFVLMGFVLNFGIAFTRYVGLNSANLFSKTTLLHYVYRGFENMFPALTDVKTLTYDWSQATLLNVVCVGIIISVIVIPLLIPLIFKVSKLRKIRNQMHI